MKQFGSIEVSWRWPLDNAELEDDLLLVAEFSYTPTADGPEDVYISDLIDATKNEVISDAFRIELLKSTLHGKTLEDKIYEGIDEKWRDKRPLQASLNIVSYVKHCPGHKNSKGEAAPWCVVSHETGKILSSHKTEEAAKTHLKQMEMHKHMKAALTFEEEYQPNVPLFSPNDRVRLKDDPAAGLGWVVGFDYGPKGVRLVKIKMDNGQIVVKPNVSVEKVTPGGAYKIGHCGPCSVQKWWAIQQLSDLYFKDKQAVDNNLVAEMAKVSGETASLKPFFELLGKALDKLNTIKAEEGKVKYGDLQQKLAQIYFDLTEVQKKLDEGVFQVVDKEDTGNKKESSPENDNVVKEVKEDALARKMYKLNWNELSDDQQQNVRDRIEYEKPKKPIESGLAKKADSVVTVPIQIYIPDNLILEYANGSIYKGKIEKGEMDEDDWKGLVKDTAHWMWTAGRADENMYQAFFSKADWTLDPEQYNKIKSMFEALPKDKGMQKQADNMTLPMTPPDSQDGDPNEDPGSGYGGDRPGIAVEPKEGAVEGPCSRCGHNEGTEWSISLGGPACRHWGCECLHALGKSMRSILKQDIGSLKKGDVVVITGSKNDKVFFFVEKDPSLIGIVTKSSLDVIAWRCGKCGEPMVEREKNQGECDYCAGKKQAVRDFIKCHKILSKSSTFVKKLAVDFSQLIDPEVLNQLSQIKDDISLHKDEVIQNLDTLPVTPQFTPSIRLADAAQYFSFKGQVPTEQDTLNYIKASIASHTGVKEENLTDDLIRQAIWNQKKSAAPLDWSEKMLLMQQLHMANKLAPDVWRDLDTLLSSENMPLIKMGIEKLFERATKPMQKPGLADAALGIAAAPPPPKPTDPLGLNEEYVFDSINNMWVKQFKTANLISAKELRAEQNYSCPCGGTFKYYDGALGYESYKCNKCHKDINDVEVSSSEKKKSLDKKPETPLLDGMEEPPAIRYDKWPAQERTIYIGTPPMGTFAYEPYKRSAKQELEPGQIWARPDSVYFARIVEVSKVAGDVLTQEFVLDISRQWRVLPNTRVNPNVFTLESSNWQMLDEDISDLDWKRLVSFVTQKQPEPSGNNVTSIWNALAEEALWSPEELKILSPREISDKKDQLLDKFNKGEISKEKLQTELKRLSSLVRKADFLPMPTPSYSGGFMDSPGPGLGRVDTGDAIFPSNETLPKGQTNKSVNEDKNIEYFPSPGDTDQKENPVELEIKHRYGKPYMDAYIMLKQTVSGQDSVDSYIDALIEGSSYVLDKNILKELVDRYLRRDDDAI